MCFGGGCWLPEGGSQAANSHPGRLSTHVQVLLYNGGAYCVVYDLSGLFLGRGRRAPAAKAVKVREDNRLSKKPWLGKCLGGWCSRHLKVYPVDVRLTWPVAKRGRPRRRYIPDILSMPAEDMLANAKWQTVSWRTWG